ncbi:hypothetical protein KTAU_21020 [Thermogemmatispora aurantia]|jgi:hypothetical protein|uniref:CBM2 domain-containing protein n=1 Tax=Thermogemmatispora aurantia TaxID=2045279 RepID=A0A5J4K7F2_9CHLR|nr:cellulose binding domain-containing protein [Thermogemmatispora aurantia]GER83465.1 hypothetical protein KTAU_21020 [Thermogemmatispora aurantia]
MRSIGRSRFLLIGLTVVVMCSLVAGLLSRARVSYADSYCQVSYTITSQWSGGFGANIVIQNTSGTAWNGWTLTFTFPAAGQSVTQGWNGTFSQSGQDVTVTNASWNGSVPANGTVNPGFNGTWTTSNPVPTAFAVNGNACNSGVSATATPGSTPTPTAGTTPSPTPTPTPALTPTATASTTPTPGIPGVPTTPLPLDGVHTGNATWFSGVGSPYGGCGVPDGYIDSPYYVALNVQNTPGDYSTYLPRPISAQNASKIGVFDNGLNCGRWVRVTIGAYCTGINDGAPNQPFCRNGSWVNDQYTGATLDLVVADSCQDGNAWCRDDPYHLDIVQRALNQFQINGQPVGNMYPNAWNNRQISWQFIPAPNYTGDIHIAFLQGANPYWSAISITHLANGIHGVDYYQNGTWVHAQMDADMGNDYVILPTTPGGSQYAIRVYDVTDQLINNGRIYYFSYPSSCGSSCPSAYTPVTYTTG